MPFVNSYTFSSAARFRTLVPASSAGSASPGGAGDALAIGVDGERGLAARIRADGTVAWSTTYALPEFVDGVAAEEDGFALLAAAAPEANAKGSPARLLVRVDGSGNVLWAHQVTEAGNIGRVLRWPGAPEEFLVMVSAPRAPATYGLDVIDLVRFGADGSRLGSKRLTVPEGGRIFDAVSGPRGYVLVGDWGIGAAVTAAQWVAADPAVEFAALGKAGLIVTLDPLLRACTCRLLQGTGRDAVSLSLRSVAVTPSGAFVAAGAVQGPDAPAKALAMTFVADFVAEGAFTYALDSPLTRPVRIDASAENAVVLIGHRPDAAAAASQVLRLDAALAPRARHGFDFDAGTQVFDLRMLGGQAAMAGALPAPKPGSALLLSVDQPFSCCRTHDLEIPAYGPIKLVFVEGAKCELAETRSESPPVKVETIAAPAKVASACGTVAVAMSDPRLVQSPYLSLQAAGSDGVDASRGVLLRWFFNGALDEHLPKGTQAQSNVGFNKPNDFVAIYRAPWPTSVSARRLNFSTDRPRYVDDTERILYFETGTAVPPDLFVVQFSDAAAYAAAKQTVNPAADPAGFLAAYGAHPFEVEVRNVLAIACDLAFHANATGSLQLETRSVGENRPLASKQVTSRRILTAADGPVARLFAENMRSVRLRAIATQVQAVSFVCYDDVLTDVNTRAAWTDLGRFALSLDQPTVFGRLEDPARFTVHGLWRKFDAAALVNVANYQAGWSEPLAGVGAAVQTYLQLSDTDPLATAQLAGTGPDDGSISASYLDLLQIASSDYHIARMLGLGCVDDAVQPATAYIHLVEYHTLGDLEDGLGARAVQHLYLSLPTTLGQYRLPLVPDLDAIDYGLTVPTGSGVPYQLTDSRGYTPDGLARFIKLYPGCRLLYMPEQGFFDPPDLFDLSAISLPAFYAVEYRRQGETTWRKPVIAHDDAFFDTASPPVPEVLTTPFPVTQHASAFVHKETEAGIHEYAVRGVNLFSRASSVGAARATDATVFTARNTLLPPSDLKVQFIQLESTPVLTTASEQAMLATLTQGAGDTTLVRVCCNYGMAHDAAYGFADTIEILHRRQVPGNVTGAVATIGAASDPALVRIETTAYTYSSAQQSIPVLPAAMKQHFIGGVLVAGGTRLVIEDIQWPVPATGENPVFLVRKPTTTGVVNNAGSNTIVVQDAPLAIYPADLVMAIENMAAAATWGAGNPLTATIQIGDATWTTRIETFTRTDGTSVTRRLRGAWDGAQIDPVANQPNQYDITFHNYVLGSHPQAQAANPVNWWKGIVRAPVAGRDPEDRRSLTVLQVLTGQAGKLVLRAMDDSGEPDGVAVGSAQSVNYYPGYKIYLHADAANGFDTANLAPASGEGSRTTLLGLRSRDSSTVDDANQAYRSAVSVPQLLAAMEIREPKPPRQPTGLKYASPPDVNGKSSYTLTVAFDHEPFAAAFYRADALSMLDAIYASDGDGSSLARIRAVMFPPGNDAYFTVRFDDLLAFLDDGRASPDAIPGAGDFALPVPDAPALQLSGGPPSATDKEKIKVALLNAFVPLSEQPLIYDLIRADPTYVPTNRPQKFRDANGDLLPPSDPQFDLAPMAKRPGPNSVQFIDYTLDGSMNPNTVYFYCAREIGNRMQIGEPSPIFGAVKLVNLTAPTAPKLRKIATVPFDQASGAGPRVSFEVIVASPIDPMAKLRIYRTSVAADALSVRTMRIIDDIDLSTLAQTADATLIVADDFSHDPFVPYGDPLFYRLAWIREVTFEDANQVPQTLDVVSEPTRTFLANVVDVVNPLPPIPAFSVHSTAANGDKVLRAAWTPTVHNGTYYLSRMSPSGSWIRIGALATNDPAPILDLPDPLPVNDDDANTIYYRFKFDVEGSSGLLNLVDAPVTVRLDTLS